MTDPLQDRRKDDPIVQVIVTRLDALHVDITDMKSALKELAAAILKLAVVEERQMQFQQAQERMFVALERIDARVDVLEKAAPASMRTADWLDKAIWAIVVVVGVFIAKKTGLL